MEQVIEKCGCGADVEADEGHEINGQVLCFNCYEFVMDELIFGDPFGEW